MRPGGRSRSVPRCSWTGPTELMQKPGVRRLQPTRTPRRGARPSGDCRQKLKIEVSTAPHSTRSGRGASCRCGYATPIERKLQERRQPTAMPHAHAGACARTPLCTVLAGAHFLALCGAACRPACVTNRHGRRLRARHLVRRASRPQHPARCCARSTRDEKWLCYRQYV